MVTSEEIQQLAETLKNSGLAASMEDALERAKSMLGQTEAGKNRGVAAAEKKVEPRDNVIPDSSQQVLGSGVEDRTDDEPLAASCRPKEEDPVMENACCNDRCSCQGFQKGEESAGKEDSAAEKPESKPSEKDEEEEAKQKAMRANNSSQYQKIDLTEIFNVNK
ncbi:hypothetical protein KY358_04830 [Candidatus Woesearchaeota archaeon]|nr:hypothetical protein [Candidatus Woesearchaeota archaeon]